MLLSLAGRLNSALQFWIDRKRLEKLCARGLRLGKDVYIMERVEFDSGYPSLIEVEDGCRISKGVRILAHDATPFRELGITRLGRVKLLKGTFVGERAIILPGVTLGPRAMVSAGSLVNRDFPEGAMVAGNPARMYGNFDDYLDKIRRDCVHAKFIPNSVKESGDMTPARLASIVEQNASVYVADVPRRDPFYVNVDMERVRGHAKAMLKDTLSLSENPEESVEGGL